MSLEETLAKHAEALAANTAALTANTAALAQAATVPKKTRKRKTKAEMEADEALAVKKAAADALAKEQAKAEVGANTEANPFDDDNADVKTDSAADVKAGQDLVRERCGEVMKLGATRPQLVPIISDAAGPDGSKIDQLTVAGVDKCLAGLDKLAASLNTSDNL